MKEAKASFSFGNVFAIAYKYVHPGIVEWRRVLTISGSLLQKKQHTMTTKYYRCKREAQLLHDSVFLFFGS